MYRKKKRNDDDDDDDDDEDEDCEDSFEESKEAKTSELLVKTPSPSNEAASPGISSQQQQKSPFFDINIIKNAKNEISKIGSSGKDLVDGIFK